MELCKIMTQNVDLTPKNKSKRLGEIKSHIENNAYDVAFLQEALYYTDIPKLRGEHNLVYKNGLFGPRGGLITAMKEQPDSLQFHKYKDQGKIISGQASDRLLGKGFLVAKKGNTSYVNTHLVAVYSDNPKRREQEQKQVSNQFEQLLEFVDKEKGRVVVGGDFNFNQNSENYPKIAEHLTDHTKPLDGKLNFDAKEGQLDFVFSNTGVASNQEVIKYEFPVSDHKGVSLELMLL